MRIKIIVAALASVLLMPASAHKYVGGDISLLADYEAHGAQYYDASGQPIARLLPFFGRQGLNAMRLRLFVDPSKATDAEKGEGVKQDLDYVKALGRRIKDAGFSLLLDFHYSDTWADPAKQFTPDAWRGLSGDALNAEYLNIMHIQGSGEIAVYMAAFVGALLGFLWYNTFPAQVFMGDTGSLTIGGVIGVCAVLIRKELMLPILCGIFLMEALSVIIQRSWFKYTRHRYGQGRRVFLMAPLHHHFQKKGIPEPRIVTRFWIIGIILAVGTLALLKIR